MNKMVRGIFDIVDKKRNFKSRVLAFMKNSADDKSETLISAC